MSETDDPTTAEETVDLEQTIDDTTDAVSIQSQALDELAGGTTDGDNVTLGQLLDVPVQVTVEVGRVRMSLGELVKLAPGSLVELEREAHEPADILVKGKTVARGEIVTIDDSYGVRITSVNS